MNYTIISSTNRPDNNSIKVANFYIQLFDKKGVMADLIDLRDLPADFTSSNMYGMRTEAFQTFQDIISKTDKFLFVIPEYNGGFPGVLKAFVDSCDFPQSFAEKKCALTGLSAGKFGNLRGISHFSGIANYIKMDVYHNKIYLQGVDNEIDENGLITNLFSVDLMEKQIEGFINF